LPPKLKASLRIDRQDAAVAYWVAVLICIL